MKRILLLNPPGSRKFLRDQYCSSSAKANYYWPAVDLLVLSGILSACFELEVIDAIALGFDHKTIVEKVSNDSYYALISLSSNASMDEDFALFKEIKDKNNIKIILNGGFLRDNPRKYLNQHSFIDALITDYIKTGILGYLKQPSGAYDGIWSKQKDKITAPTVTKEQNNDFSYPVPKHELFNLKNYNLPQARNEPFTCCIISYGCKFNCNYCASGSIDFKLRKIDNIIQELKVIKALGISEVHFPDFTFTADSKHTKQLCQAIIDANLELSWDCLTRVDCLDLETAKLMKKAGAHTIQFGIETQNEQLLKKMAKPITNQQIKTCFSVCKQLKLETIGFFIIGLPDEDEQSIKKSIDFACELDCDYAAFSVYVPDFGSPLRKQFETTNPEAAEISRFDRTMSPFVGNNILSKHKIWALRNYAIRKFYLRPKYIWKQIIKINSLEKFKSIVKMGFSVINGFIQA